MRNITFAAGVVVAAALCVSCGETGTPVSPTTTTQPAVAGDNGTQPGGAPAAGADTAAAPVGLTGVIRGLNLRTGMFSLVSRTGTRTILTDAETQVWRSGTRVRLSALSDGQAISVRGFDHQRYVLARTISIR